MKIRNNKGLTLIEVLTVIVISGILLSMISVLFYSFTTMYQQLDHQNQVTNDIVLIKNSISKFINEFDSESTKIMIEENNDMTKLVIFKDKTDEGEFIELYLDSDNSFVVNDVKIIDDVRGENKVRIANKTSISKIVFSKNSQGTILKCRIEFKTHYNRNDIQSQEFVKVLRCVKID